MDLLIVIAVILAVVVAWQLVALRRFWPSPLPPPPPPPPLSVNLDEAHSEVKRYPLDPGHEYWIIRGINLTNNTKLRMYLEFYFAVGALETANIAPEHPSMKGGILEPGDSTYYYKVVFRFPSDINRTMSCRLKAHDERFDKFIYELEFPPPKESS